MTIDEAIKNIQFVLHALDKDSEIAESYRMAIKALKQYGVLQEIRQEMDKQETVRFFDGFSEHGYLYINRDDALAIINKHIKEIEA